MDKEIQKDHLTISKRFIVFETSLKSEEFTHQEETI